MSNNLHKFASPGDRLLAFILDLIIICILFIPLYLLGRFQPQPGLQMMYYTQLEPTLTIFFAFLPFFVRMFFMAKRGQDFGKFILNLQVINHKANKKIGFLRYLFIREIIGRTFIFGLIPIFGLAWNAIYMPIDALLIFRKSRKTMHDSIAGSIVIELPKEKRRNSFTDFTSIK